MKSILLLLIPFWLWGCAEQPDSSTSEKLVVFVSIPPQAGLARAIAGDQIEIQTLVGAGQSPHAYEPTARQLARLGAADALLTIGIPFEQHLLKKIIPLYPDLVIVATDAGIARRSMPHKHHGASCSLGHGETDPHVWLSPTNAITMANNMARFLGEIDPKNAALYRKNTTQLTDQLRQLDREISTLLAPHRGARFYVFHPSFGYFAEAYGLTQIPVELDGKAPSSRQLVSLIQQAKTDGVKVIFVQQQFPIEHAKAIAEAIGGSVVQLNPMAEDSATNLRQIAEHIALALQK